MKARIQLFVIALGMGFTAFYATGCASSHYNLVKDGTIALEIMPSEEETYVYWADVYQKGNGIEISGTVMVPQTLHQTKGGHVDIAILSPDSSLLKKISVRHKSRNPRRKSAHKLPFEAYIPMKLSPESTIRIAYHKLSYSTNNSVFDCEDNPAIPDTQTELPH